MIKLIGDCLHQWEKGRKVSIKCKETYSEVHFSKFGDEEALIVEVVDDQAAIPNIFLQGTGQITAYVVQKEGDVERTICGNVFSIRERPKPADYVYTETEVKNYDVLLKRIEALEESGSDISITVDDALSEESENPVQNKVVTAKFVQLSQENVEQDNKIANKLDADKLTDAINTALTQAKESGEFDGQDGQDGTDGYTPVKGTDYWTDGDIAEIKSYVDEAILGGAW